MLFKKTGRLTIQSTRPATLFYYEKSLIPFKKTPLNKNLLKNTEGDSNLIKQTNLIPSIARQRACTNLQCCNPARWQLSGVPCL